MGARRLMEVGLQKYLSMKTLAAWINAHPGINVLAFERNHHKSFGFGEYEEVCGFCLGSHYFEEEPPEFCRFCRAPLQDTHAISNLPEITNRLYNLGSFLGASSEPKRNLPFIVRQVPQEES
jgi:hypothetical protein